MKLNAPPTTLISNSHGLASSDGGTIATNIANSVTSSPLNPTPVATIGPPGTRTVSAGAAVRRCFRKDRNR